MATGRPPSTSLDNLAELVKQLGAIPLDRIRLRPPPGTATEQDVLRAEREPRKRLCELIDGVLVEKPVGLLESILATVLLSYLWPFLRQHKLGVAAGADGMIRLWPGLVRIPDACFISRGRLPGGKVPKKAIPDLVPDLVVEILSKGNTKKEMQRKRREYFRAGVRLVWEIDPKRQTADEYTTAIKPRKIGRTGWLDGGAVLPGFKLSLLNLFAEAEGVA